MNWRIIGASCRNYGQGEWVGSLPANQPLKIQNIELKLETLVEDIFFLDLQLIREGDTLATNKYGFSRTDTLEPLLNMQTTALEVEKLETDSDRWELKLHNTGEHAAFQLHLDDDRDVEAEGYWYTSVNDFTLLPQEKARIVVEWSGIPISSRKLKLSAWNYAAIQIE